MTFLTQFDRLIGHICILRNLGGYFKMRYIIGCGFFFYILIKKKKKKKRKKKVFII
jgi:hypothetical protein